MNRRRFLFWLTAMVLASMVPLRGSAQSIYKCPLRSGGFEYTDTPCSGPGATVVHKATPGEVAAKLNEDDRQAMLSMLRVGAVEEARQYALTHHQEALYNSIVSALAQEEVQVEQRRKQQAELARQQRAQAIAEKINTLSAQNANLQQQVSEQAEEIELEREQAAKARQRARAAQNAAEAPKFNPETGQWCQQIGGTIQCH